MIVKAIAGVIRQLRERGFTVVMVEQNFRFAAPLADRFYVMEGGRMALTFPTSELAQRMDMLHGCLGV
ncbi:High-affinity branched-chain amino acid transport ATP-binding protein LivF [compost metagenome]